MKITLLKSLLVVGAFLCFGLAQAQEVTGTVSDANGPLPGASVVVKGTTTGTQTDFDGNYTIEAGSDATLVFSYVGFKTQETAVNGQASINITLQEDAEALEEVIVIGYGTTTVKDATGSVSAVTSKDFNGGVIASPEQLIQGKTAGVNIQQTSGEPGAGMNINIRGANSVRANNNPLFVVDGVALFGENTDAEGTVNNSAGSGEQGNPLSFLNPSDIESISILKDASATAIYGSRGANGVVIITTKSGKGAAGGKFEFSSSLTYSTPSNKLDILSRDEYLAALPNFGGDPSAKDFGYNTNWQDEILRNSTSTNQNLSYSNNYGSGNVRATLGYQKQFGIVEKSEFERITGRLNINQRFLDDKLKLGIQTTISRVNQQKPPLDNEAGASGDLIGSMYAANPTWPANSTFRPDGSIEKNPLNLLLETQNITHTDRFLINGTAEYSFTPELSVKGLIGYDTSDSENVSVLGPKLYVNNITDNGFGTYNTLKRDNKTLELTVNYKKELENSNFDVLVGYAYQDFRTFGRNSQARGFNTSDLNIMSENIKNAVNGAQAVVSGEYQQYFYAENFSGLNINRVPNFTTDNDAYISNSSVKAIAADTFDNTDELQSFFGRVNYSLANKYLFTATIRADGSSRFGSDNQYGYFPSAAVAWKLNEEDFIGDNVSTLKLRLSAGITGNQDGLGYGNFVTRQRWSGISINNDNTINQNGQEIVSEANPRLKWESTTDINIGLDFGFNNDRFSGSLDIYNRDTQDLLMLTPSAFPANSEYQFKNLDAGVINKGIELALAYDFIQTEDVTFSTSFNVAYNDNEVVDLKGNVFAGPINGPGLSGATAQRLSSGHSLFSYFMATFEGFDNDGNPTYADVDGNGVGDPDVDKSFVGEDGLPDITSGLSLNLRVKNWDLGAYFSGQFGFSVYNNTANALLNAGQLGTGRNVTRNVVSEGEDPGASTAVSTRFLEKGDFVRFQNASLGYSVPLSGEGLFDSMRLSLTGQNLFIITDYSGADPEVSVATGNFDGANLPTRSIDWAAYPSPRTITFGINMSF